MAVVKPRSPKKSPTKTSSTSRVTRSASKDAAADHTAKFGTATAPGDTQNTVQSGGQTEQQNGAQSATSSDLDRRFEFVDLPPELRMMVWEYASGVNPRGITIEVRLDITGTDRSDPIFALSSPPGTPYPSPIWTSMVTNTESRGQFLARFPEQLSLHPVVNGTPTGRSIRFNMRIDTILMDVRSLYVLMVFILFNNNPQLPHGLASIRNLATPPMNHNIWGLARFLRQQQGLLGVVDPITRIRGVPGAISTWAQMVIYLMGTGTSTTGLSQWFAT